MNKRTIIIGGLLAVLLLGSVGAVFTTAQDSTGITPTTDPWQTHSLNGSAPFHGDSSRAIMTCQPMFRGGRDFRFIPPGVNLTAAQRSELNGTLVALREQNATMQETRLAIFQLLDSFGVYDAQLNTSISNTQRRLDILNREKELRSQGYNWTTIETMIHEEFGNNTQIIGPNSMMSDRGFGCPGPRGHGRPD